MNTKRSATTSFVEKENSVALKRARDSWTGVAPEIARGIALGHGAGLGQCTESDVDGCTGSVPGCAGAGDGRGGVL